MKFALKNNMFNRFSKFNSFSFNKHIFKLSFRKFAETQPVVRMVVIFLCFMIIYIKGKC